LGIYILEAKHIVDNTNTFSYDAVNGVLSIAATIVYRTHYNDVQRPAGLQDETSSRLLHPYFLMFGNGKHLDILLWLALIALSIETIFVQTII
jgi:hypothetical protein